MVPEKPMKRCKGFTYCLTVYQILHQGNFQNTNEGLDMEGNPILLDKF